MKVEVTDAAGETQEGVLVLPVGEHAIGLQIKGLAGKVAREKLDKMQVQALNMQQQPVALDVVCSLYTLDEAGKKQQTVWGDTVKSGQPFQPEAWKKLASGKYLLEVTASDEHGRPCRAEQELVLFSLKDRVPPVKTVEWFYQDGTQLEETQPVTLYVGSSEKNVHLFYHVYSGNRMLVSDSFVLNEEIRPFDYTWRPEYGDGITVSFGFMKDGIWYSKQVALKRPVPEKKLTLKWEVFRDRLRPGTEETWTMQILDAAGKPADARLLATLYDASLDRLWDNPWNFQLGFGRYTPSVMPFIQSVNSIAMAYSPFYTYSLSSVYTPDNWQLYSRLWVPSLRQYRTFSRNGLMVRGAGIMMKAAAAAPDAMRADEALNDVSSIAGELTKNKGYSSAFFHGAMNGSMGFQAFARSVGFQKYFGRTEYNEDPNYNGDADFDGTWAIWDEEFLQFYCDRMSEMKEPFVTSVFTATSHGPFDLPERYKGKFPTGDDPLFETVAYSDYAIQRFFEKAEKQPWFENTLFVITADHTSGNCYPEYVTDLGYYNVPVIFYAPGLPELKGLDKEKIVDQIDIMPTVLGILGYDRPYVGFGQDAFHTPASEKFAVNYLPSSGIYQFLKGDYLIQFDGEKVIHAYRFRTDVLMKDDVKDSMPQEVRKEMETQLKSIIQQYMQRMNNNELVYRE